MGRCFGFRIFLGFGVAYLFFIKRLDFVLADYFSVLGGEKSWGNFILD